MRSKIRIALVVLMILAISMGVTGTAFAKAGAGGKGVAHGTGAGTGKNTGFFHYGGGTHYAAGAAPGITGKSDAIASPHFGSIATSETAGGASIMTGSLRAVRHTRDTVAPVSGSLKSYGKSNAIASPYFGTIATSETRGNVIAVPAGGKSNAIASPYFGAIASSEAGGAGGFSFPPPPRGAGIII